MIVTVEIWYRNPSGYEVHRFPLEPGAGFELDMVPRLTKPGGTVAKIAVTGPPLSDEAAHRDRFALHADADAAGGEHDAFGAGGDPGERVVVAGLVDVR